MRTASLINMLSETANAPSVKAGDGATILGWTDRKACTVVEVTKNGKRIVVTRDIATRIDKNGMSEAQTYEYATDPEGYRQVFTWRSNKRYVAEGSPASTGTVCVVGYRRPVPRFFVLISGSANEHLPHRCTCNRCRR